MIKIILASASPRRKELLEKLAYDFEVEIHSIKEVFNRAIPIDRAIVNIAYQKGVVAANFHYNDIVISADTMVVINGNVLGKPKDEEDAFNMLKLLSGNTHEVISGVCVFYQDEVYQFSQSTSVKFNVLSDEDINEYIDSGEYIDKAGSYAIQGIGSRLVESIDGEYENVVGLPIKKLKEVIEGIINK